MEKEELNSKLSTIKVNYAFSKLKAKIKNKSKVVIQSLLFPVKSFTIESAMKWAKGKGYKSESATVSDSNNFIHLRQKSPGRYNTYKTVILADGVKARIAVNSNSKFAGHILLSNFSKFSDKIKSDTDMRIPMSVEFKILCEGQNRDGFVRREDLEESLELWKDIPIIDFHDDSDDPTNHKMSDRKGYTLGNPYLKFKEGKMWVITPGEIIDRNLAYQAYIREKRGKPLEISAEFKWNKQIINGQTYQTNIRPHIISIVDKGHIEGNKLAIMS